ncbi:hypothetical protein KI387_019208, partial [Taxus chinensis]
SREETYQLEDDFQFVYVSKEQLEDELQALECALHGEEMKSNEEKVEMMDEKTENEEETCEETQKNFGFSCKILFTCVFAGLIDEEVKQIEKAALRRAQVKRKRDEILIFEDKYMKKEIEAKK